MRLIIIIPLFFCLTANSQLSNGEKTALLYSGSIILEAAGDAMIHSGEYHLGSSLNSAGMITLLFSPVIIDYHLNKTLLYIISYAALKIGLYIPMYNLSRSLWMLGDHKVTSQGLKDYGGIKDFTKGCVLMIGVHIPLTRLNKKNNGQDNF